MKAFFRIVVDLLREIGDERPYERYLHAHGIPHSAAAWRRFSDERYLAASRRARCC